MKELDDAIIEGEFTVVEEEKKTEPLKSDVMCYTHYKYCDNCGAFGGDCQTACVPMDYYHGG